jgi:crotonobetainyl-CoA:carnitine CoA-transferase CaiB-like acyl-CoA transferase
MAAERPLTGVRVLETARGLAAAFAARLLADAGADVVRIEDGPAPSLFLDVDAGATAGSDVARSIYAYANRGKQIAPTADPRAADVWLWDREGRDALDPALRQATEATPHLISVGVTPFGQRGPHAGWAGDDLVLCSAGGLTFATPGFPDYAHDLRQEGPLRPNAYVSEFLAGVDAAAAAIAALIYRDRTGIADRVDLSRQDAVAATLIWDQVIWSYSNVIAGRRQVRAALAPNAYLPTGDGWAAVVAFLEPHWRALVEEMGNPEWASLPQFATGQLRGQHWDELEPLLIGWLVEHSGVEITTRLQSRGVPTAAVLELDAALTSPQARERAFLVPANISGVPSGAMLPGDPIAIDYRRRESGPPPRRVSAAEVASRWQPRTPTEADDPPQTPPLAGVRIIDFSQIVALPMAAQWLAMLGAEVILIESRRNLPSRGFAPFAGTPGPDTCGIFNAINRSKRSVTIDLTKPRGLALVRQMIARSNAVVENFTTGTMERLGLGYDDLKALRPGIVMLSLSAFGRSGPWRDYAALHSGVMALSGFAAATGYPGGHPRLAGSLLPDPLSGAYCALALLAALRHQRLTGEGCRIDIAMAEALQSFLPHLIYEFTATGRTPARIGNADPFKAPHDVYPCVGDDAWVAISVANTAQWHALCSVIGRDDLARDERLTTPAGRRAYAAEIDAAIRAWTSVRDKAEAAVFLQTAGVPAAPAESAADLVNDPHLAARAMFVAVEHPVAGCYPAPRIPWLWEKAPPAIVRHAPPLGEGTEDVLRGVLGLSTEEIRALTDEGVLQ